MDRFLQKKLTSISESKACTDEPGRLGDRLRGRLTDRQENTHSLHTERQGAGSHTGRQTHRQTFIQHMGRGRRHTDR